MSLLLLTLWNRFSSWLRLTLIKVLFRLVRSHLRVLALQVFISHEITLRDVCCVIKAFNAVYFGVKVLNSSFPFSWNRTLPFLLRAEYASILASMIAIVGSLCWERYTVGNRWDVTLMAGVLCRKCWFLGTDLDISHCCVQRVVCATSFHLHLLSLIYRPLMITKHGEVLSWSEVCALLKLQHWVIRVDIGMLDRSHRIRDKSKRGGTLYSVRVFGWWTILFWIWNQITWLSIWLGHQGRSLNSRVVINHRILWPQQVLPCRSSLLGENLFDHLWTLATTIVRCVPSSAMTWFPLSCTLIKRGTWEESPTLALLLLEGGRH